MTFADILEKLKQEDEVSFLEILDLSSEELVVLLEDTIYDKQERIRAYYDESDEDQEDS